MKRKSLLTLLTLLSALFGSGWNASAQILTTLINGDTNEELMIEEKPVEAHRKTSARFVPAPVDGERIIMEVVPHKNCTIEVNADAADANSIWADLNGNGQYDQGEEIKVGKKKQIRFKQREAIVYGKMKGFLYNGYWDNNAIWGIITLDLSNCPNLTSLDCASNALENLDLSATPNLTVLKCQYNKLTSLDLSATPNLTTLVCGGPALVSLNLSNSPNLTELQCSNSSLTSLDLSTCQNLKELTWEDNQSTTLDLSATPNLTTLVCGGPALVSLNLSNSPNLTKLQCSNSSLTSLDLSTCQNLKILTWKDNQSTTLDLSATPNLTTLVCSGTALTSLNVSGCTKLKELHCNNTSLATLDISTCSDLNYLNSRNNQLTSLNLSGVSSLKTLLCQNNQLTELDLTTCQNLGILFCSNNQISQLDFSQNPKLNDLSIYGNRIKSEQMRLLVESLPVLDLEEVINSYNPMSYYYSDLYVLNSKDENEQNEFPLDLLPMAKAKGWVPKDRGLNIDENGNQTFNDNAIGATYEVTPEYIDINFIDEAVGKEIHVGLTGENLWADLNSNGQYDEGESIRSEIGINSAVRIQLASSSLRIYGKDITRTIMVHGYKDINLSNVKNLRRIWSISNLITHLDLKENKELRVLQVSGAQDLTSLETDCPKLHTLLFWGSKKFRPELSLYPELKWLGIDAMGLTSLDLSQNKKLKQLTCSMNELTQLDLSQIPELVSLDCSSNKLTGLDLSHNPDLRYLKCSNNLIDEAAMQALVESLPEVIIRDEPANFIPVNPNGDDNVCTPDQVAIAKSKNWNVTTPMGDPFVGTSIEEVIPAEVYHNIKVWARDGILYLSGLEPGMPVQVYAIDGTMMHTSVASGSTLEIPLPRGAAYVLRAGNHAVKAVMP